MANLSFQGKITQISEPQTGTSAKGDWTKSNIIVEDDAQYPNSIAFDAFNKQEIVDTLEVGQNVEVLYNAKTSEYQGRIFNSLNLWKVEIQGISSTNTPPTSSNIKTAKASVSVGATESDDLPF